VTGPERTIRVRCATWGQVEKFYRQKLRANTLLVKMPFEPPLAAPVTVALGLPNGLVLAIDGEVAKVAPSPEGRFAVSLKMTGFDAAVAKRLERLVEDGRRDENAPVEILGEGDPELSGPTRLAPPEPQLSEEDRAVLAELEGTRRRLLDAATHEVLGVAPDADAAGIRAAYLALARRWHPDSFGVRPAPVRLAAAELLIHLNRAFERLAGETADAQVGWLVAPEPMERGAARVEPPVAAPSGSRPPAPKPPERVSMASLAAALPPDERDEPDDRPFDTARTDPLSADELFDDALVNDPRVTGAGDALVASAALAKIPTVPPQPPAGTQPPPTPMREAALAEALAAGRAALDAGRWTEAREQFAAALRADPRHRTARGLYHVASGHDLRARGEAAQATLQFETALAHDRECDEARRALQGADPKKGILRRLFDR
jgi:hypothetical protein